MQDISHAKYRPILALGRFSSIITAFFVVVSSLLIGIDMFTERFISGTFSSPSHLIPQMAFAFFIPFSFLIVTACIHVISPDERKVFSIISIALASAAIAVDSTVFYTQLVVVLPQTLSSGTMISPFAFLPGSFQYATEFFGCMLLSFSALALSFVFQSTKLEGRIKALLFITGILSIPLALSVSIPWFWFNVAPLWGISFPGAMFLLAVYFQKKKLSLG